ncbi:ROK family protein [Microbacterium sp. LWH7-1.2]|uniref:ROK family protein n=1 Tax=Microbacterium sp. LWH7-1.2 TaxID=3135257 RepID=UPI0032518520
MRDSARGLGVLVTAICNLTLPDRIIITGEVMRLAVVGHQALKEKTRELRDTRAKTPPISHSSSDNVEGAAGAAVLAIQSFALGTPRLFDSQARGIASTSKRLPVPPRTRAGDDPLFVSPVRLLGESVHARA